MGRRLTQDPLVPHTNRVCTFWYRPLELLLGQRVYGSSIDMWSSGCIFGEMLSGKPLFVGDGDRDVVERIYCRLGNPADDWPEVKALERWEDWKPLPKRVLPVYGDSIEHLFGKHGGRVVALMKLLMGFDPQLRRRVRAKITCDDERKALLAACEEDESGQLRAKSEFVIGNCRVPCRSLLLATEDLVGGAKRTDVEDLSFGRPITLVFMTPGRLGPADALRDGFFTEPPTACNRSDVQLPVNRCTREWQYRHRGKRQDTAIAAACNEVKVVRQWRDAQESNGAPAEKRLKT